MRLIDADALIAYCYEEWIPLNVDAVNEQPTIEERKTGEWIKNDNGTYSCSICKSWIPEEQHFYARYCLYCGADMRGGKNGAV